MQMNSTIRDRQGRTLAEQACEVVAEGDLAAAIGDLMRRARQNAGGAVWDCIIDVQPV
jgi:hypothetical protein